VVSGVELAQFDSLLALVSCDLALGLAHRESSLSVAAVGVVFQVGGEGVGLGGHLVGQFGSLQAEPDSVIAGVRPGSV
jgi:hypothetical protein